MKRMIALGTLLMASVVSHAETETIDGYTWTYQMLGDNSISIRDVSPKFGEITIPASIGGHRVWQIEPTAFAYASNITSVIVSEGIKQVYSGSFINCINLSCIRLPLSVTLDGDVFNGCTNLREVIMPGDITLGSSAGVGLPESYPTCTTMNSITYVEGTKVIRKRSLLGSEVVTNVVIPQGVIEIAEGTFSACRLLPQITLPKSLISVGANIFASCYSLTNVTFLGDAPVCDRGIFSGANRDLVVYVPVGSKGWDGNPESTALPKYWPFNTDGGRRIVHIGETVNDEPPVVTNYVYSTVTNYIHTTVTNEVFHYSMVTNEVHHHTTDEIHHYSTVTNEVFHYTTVTNELFHYSTVTNEVQNYMTVTNELHHYETVTNEVQTYSTVTNVIHVYTTVTNVVKYVPEPGANPDAGYGINVGAGGETVIAGAAGWDAFGVPDGMEWDKETGTLSGRAKLSGAYDLILVSGSGADTKIMRTTLTVAPYDTIVGYVGVAFSQGGAPLDNFKSYTTLPAGLKWKNGKLSGVPTKKQTVKLVTKDGEPVTIKIRALPAAAVGSFSGAVMDGGRGATALPVGRVTLNVTTAGKISGKIYEGGRIWTLSAANFSSTSVPTDGEFRVSGTATRTAKKKTYVRKWSLVITVDDGRGVTALPGATMATGTFGDSMTIEAQRNFWKDKDAAALITDWIGEYAWTAPDGGRLTLVLNDVGIVKATGKLNNGQSLSLSVPLTYHDGVRKALIYVPPQTIDVKSGKNTVSQKCPEFIAVVKLNNEPGISLAGGDIAYRYR